MELKFEPITNADRIRNMTDEELAMFICSVRCQSFFGGDCGSPYCHSMNGDWCNGIKVNTDITLMMWLKEEVKNG